MELNDNEKKVLDAIQNVLRQKGSLDMMSRMALQKDAAANGVGALRFRELEKAAKEGAVGGTSLMSSADAAKQISDVDQQMASRKHEIEMERNHQPIIEFMESGLISRPDMNCLIAKTHVTQKLWAAVMDGDDPSFFKDPDRPVESVSWNDCNKFIEKLNSFREVKDRKFQFRMIRDTEWDTLIKELNADEKESEDYGWFWKNSNYATHSVATKKAYKSGLYDLVGNVMSWVVNSKGVCVGGCYRSGHSDCFREQISYVPEEKINYVGLRLVAMKF